MDSIYEQFIDKYIHGTNHSYFLVYFYALRNRNDENISPFFYDIACNLSMILSDVRDAFFFWQRQGIAKVLDNDSAVLTFNTYICEESLKKFEPICNDLSRDNDLAELYEEVSRILNVDISSKDIRTIYSIYDDLKIDAYLILALVANAKAKGKGISYVEKTAVQWKSMGIDSLEKADLFFKHEEEKNNKKIKDKNVSCVPKASKFSNFQQRNTSYRVLEDMYLKNVYDNVCTKEE